MRAKITEGTHIILGMISNVIQWMALSGAITIAENLTYKTLFKEFDR
jgi:hypothetical protein